MIKKLFFVLLFCVTLFPCMAQSKMKNDQTILFAGDRMITSGNSTRGQRGFIYLIRETLKKSGHKGKITVSGIAADNSTSFFKRMPKAVLAKKTAWLILSIGYNDALAKKPSLDTFKSNIVKILDLAGKNGIKVIVMTTSTYGEKLAAPKNKLLAPYNEFLRAEAKKRNLPLADVYQALCDEIAKKELACIPAGKVCRYNALNGRGHFVAASSVLASMGFSKEFVAGTRKNWEAKYPVSSIYFNINFSEFLANGKAGAKENKNVKEYIFSTIQKAHTEKGK